MSLAGFTSGQRRVIVLMGLAVVVVLSMLAGFVVTSLQGWESLPPSATAPPSVLPTAVPPTPPPTLPPSPTAAPTSVLVEDGIWSQVQAARLFDQVAHQVETMRGLAPRAEVPLSFLDEGEMATLLRRSYVGRDLGTPLLPYVELGLLPEVSIRVRARPAAGIYVSEQGQLYVTTGSRESGADDQALLAHAYIHALQDQHFDLRAMDDRATTSDAALAVRAFVEGDAALLTAMYRYGELSAADWQHVSELILQAEEPDYGQDLNAVAAWTRLQRFPYWEGRLFAHALFQVGGWDAINGAYTNLPRSTEQVLHPERYLEDQDGPTQVIVPDLGVVLDQDWTTLVRDTLGEFVIGLYLETLLPEEMAWQAADGWDGDTFVVWERKDGERLLVWRTIWDSTAEAAEFENAMAALIRQRYVPAWPLDPPRGLTGQWWETGAGGICVARVARHVVFVHAPDVDTLTDAVEALP